MSRVSFSISIKDLREEFYRGSGNGGQKKQKTSSGVRLTHEASGVMVEDESTRSQAQNRVAALKKLAAHPKFRAWCQMEVAAREEGHRSLLTKIDESLKPEYLKIEVTSTHAPKEAFCDVKPHGDSCGCFGCRYVGHAGR